MPSLYKPAGAYIPPPRAAVAQDISFLPQREAEGKIAQIKKNGTHSVIMIDPDRNVVAWDRYGEVQKAWSFTEETEAVFHALPNDHKWYIYDGELIHNKTKHIKGQLYLYDILVCEGIHLTGTNYLFRYQLLFDTLARGKTFDAPTPQTQYWRLDPHVSIARNYPSGFGFTDLFLSLTDMVDEGLVLRNPEGIYTGPKADDWMVKFRRKELTKLY